MSVPAASLGPATADRSFELGLQPSHLAGVGSDASARLPNAQRPESRLLFSAASALHQRHSPSHFNKHRLKWKLTIRNRQCSGVKGGFRNKRHMLPLVSLKTHLPASENHPWRVSEGGMCHLPVQGEGTGAEKQAPSGILPGRACCHPPQGLVGLSNTIRREPEGNLWSTPPQHIPSPTSCLVWSLYLFLRGHHSPFPYDSVSSTAGRLTFLLTITRHSPPPWENYASLLGVTWCVCGAAHCLHVPPCPVSCELPGPTEAEVVGGITHRALKGHRRFLPDGPFRPRQCHRLFLTGAASPSREP